MNKFFLLPFERLKQHPFSLFLFIASILLALFFTMMLSVKGLYQKSLAEIDMSSLIMASLLTAKTALYSADNSKLKLIAVICLFNVSFLLGFEFIYKFLFFAWVVEPAELRELVLFGAAATGGLYLYSDRKVRITRAGQYSLLLFAVTMLFWFFCGYPQLFKIHEIEPVSIPGITIEGYPHLIPVELNRTGVYIVNRIAKGALWLFFMFSIPEQRTH